MKVRAYSYELEDMANSLYFCFIFINNLSQRCRFIFMLWCTCRLQAWCSTHSLGQKRKRDRKFKRHVAVHLWETGICPLLSFSPVIHGSQKKSVNRWVLTMMPIWIASMHVKACSLCWNPVTMEKRSSYVVRLTRKNRYTSENSEETLVLNRFCRMWLAADSSFWIASQCAGRLCRTRVFNRTAATFCRYK